MLAMTRECTSDDRPRSAGVSTTRLAASSTFGLGVMSGIRRKYRKNSRTSRCGARVTGSTSSRHNSGACSITANAE